MKRLALRAVMSIALLLLVLGSNRAIHAQDASKLTISPSTGTPGSVVTLTAPPGSLPGGSIAEVDFVDATGLYVGLPIARVQINADGSLNFNVAVVPEAAAGTARIYVTSAGISISNTFTVRPGITVSPPAQQQKMVFEITGNGFQSNSTITFQINTSDAGLQPAQPVGQQLVITDQFGTFSSMLVVPRGSPVGGLEIAASDGTYTATTILTVTDPQALTAPAPTATATVPFTGTITGPAASTATPAPTLPVSPTPAASPTTAPPSGGTQAYFAEGFTGQAATNGRATFREVLNILNPYSTAAQATITYYIQGSTVPVQVTRTVAPASVFREPVNDDVGPDKQVAALVSSSQRLYVTRTISRLAANGSRLDGSTTLPAAAPANSWGFPEGYTGYSFQEYLTLLNPSTATARVSVVLAPQGNSAAGAHTLSLTVPPVSRTTANITALNAASTTKSVAMLVTGDRPIVAERVVYFGDGSGSGKFGSTASGGVAAPAPSLHFAYGASGGAVTSSAGLAPQGDQHFITLLNPAANGAPIAVTVSFADADGRTLGHTTVAVNPGTRKTIVSNTVLGRNAVAPFSVSLQATGPIEAEAAQYFGGSPNSGAHPGVAFPAIANPGSDLFLSDLSTALADGAGVSRVVYLYNPGAAPIAVAATYFGAHGTPVQAVYAVPAGGITTVPVNQVIGGALPAGPLGAEFKLSSGSGSFIAYAIGRTADGRSATEDVGVSP